MIKKCPSCNESNSDETVFYRKCGKKLSAGKTVPVKSFRKKPGGLKIFLAILFSLTSIALITFGVSCLFNDAFEVKEINYSNGEKERILKEELSEDQQRLVTMIGYPDEFVIIFDESSDNLRVETWLYEAVEASFAFEDGKYDGSTRYVAEDLSSDSYDLKPEDFVYSMTPDEVSYLTGEDGNEIIDSNTGYKVLTFGRGIIICTFNTEDELINVARLKKLKSGEG